MENLGIRRGRRPHVPSPFYDCLQNEDPWHQTAGEIGTKCGIRFHRNACPNYDFLFCGHREQGLEVWGLSLPRDDADLNPGKPRSFEDSMQLDFGEPEPNVRIEFARLLVAVAGKVENYYPPSFSEDTMRGGYSSLRT